MYQIATDSVQSDIMFVQWNRRTLINIVLTDWEMVLFLGPISLENIVTVLVLLEVVFIQRWCESKVSQYDTWRCCAPLTRRYVSSYKTSVNDVIKPLLPQGKTRLPLKLLNISDSSSSLRFLCNTVSGKSSSCFI